MHNEKIIVAKISLHYETQPTFIYWELSRESYARMIFKEKNKHSNWYYKRVSYSKAIEITEIEGREIAKKEYSRQIMEKYNVGPNWKENRWFMEQVRPTI